jgi:hypothetical protein
MKRERLLERLDRAWRDFRASYEGASEAEFLEGGVVEDWSIRDLIVHVAVWEEEALKHLPLILEGKRPPRYSVTYGGIDAFNARAMLSRAALPLDEVMSRAEKTHRQLVRLIEAAPDDQIATETRFRRRLRLDTYAHYPLHARAIREWRQNRARAPAGVSGNREDVTR